MTDSDRLKVIEELISEEYHRLAWLERKRDQLRERITVTEAMGFAEDKAA